jgi:hypothetical protein
MGAEVRVDIMEVAFIFVPVKTFISAIFETISLTNRRVKQSPGGRFHGEKHGQTKRWRQYNGSGYFDIASKKWTIGVISLWQTRRAAGNAGTCLSPVASRACSPDYSDASFITGHMSFLKL